MVDTANVSVKAYQNLKSLPLFRSRSSIFCFFLAMSAMPFAIISDMSSLDPATPAFPLECSAYLRCKSSVERPSNSPASIEMSTPLALRCNRK